MAIFILFFSFLVFLFCLYQLGKDDFIFIRRNISMENLFNIAIISGIFALFFSRLVFAVFNFDKNFLNPLVFFLFTYFPGLSLPGAVIGGIFYLSYLSKRRKLPLGRITDFFALSLLCSLPIAIIGMSLLKGSITVITFVVPILYIFFFVFFLKLLLPRLQRGSMKDGTLATLFLAIFSLLTLFSSILKAVEKQQLRIGAEDYLLIALFLVSIMLLVKQELIKDKRSKTR